MTMYTDRNAMVEYEYDGTFYKKGYGVPDDGDLLSDERDDETVILTTKCDIQKTDKLFTSGVVSMGYNIYFPMPQTDEGEERLPEGMKVGIRFRGELENLHDLHRRARLGILNAGVVLHKVARVDFRTALERIEQHATKT